MTVPATVPAAADQPTPLESLFALSTELLSVSGTDGYFKRVNPAFERTLGWTAAELTDRPFIDFVHPDDRAATAARVADLRAGVGVVHFENRYRCRDGGYRWLSWASTPAVGSGQIYSVARDVTARKRQDALAAAQNGVLEAIATGVALPAVLMRIVRLVEDHAPGMLCSILVLDDTHTRVHVAAAPSIAPEYARAIEGARIGPTAGSCGTAAFRGETVIVTDIATDPLWTDYRALAMPHGLRACWSTPFLSPKGSVLGTLAMYYHEPRAPEPAERRLLDLAGHLTGIAVCAHQAANEIGLLYQAVEHLHDGVLITEQEPGNEALWRIVYVNAAFERRTGWRRDEVIGRAPAILFGPRTSQASIDRITAARLHGKRTGVELVTYGKDGTEYLVAVDVVPVTNDEGAITHWVSIERDVSERERTREALERSQVVLRTIVASAPMMVWSVDRTGIFTMCDGSAIGALGATPDEMIGRSVYTTYGDMTFVDGSGAPTTAEAAVRRALAGEQVTGTGEADGVHFEHLFAPLHDADGAIDGMLGVSLVVTARKELEHQLRHAQKMEAVGRLAGGVAHDFNNILTGIIGFAELAEGRVGTTPSPGALQEIASAARRAAELTRRLLAFSRQQVLQPQLLAVNALVQGTERLLGRLLGDHIELRTDLSADPWVVLADPSQLEQVVMNLAVNARDAMADGGIVTLRTRNVRLGAGATSVAGDLAPGEYVEFSVSDTGVGMDAEVQSHIFEPFFTTKPPGRGTGLGLSTVYGVVEQSGGRISVESSVGAGSTFTVLLPRAVGQPSVAATAAPSAASAGGSETLLIVEDEPMLRRLMKITLERSGFAAIVAESGEEALELAAAHTGPLPMLVTDVVMPNMSGRQLTARMLELRPEMKVLYLSGYTDDEIVRHGVLDEDVAFLQKPFTPAVLVDKIREVLDRA